MVRRAAEGAFQASHEPQPSHSPSEFPVGTSASRGQDDVGYEFKNIPEIERAWDAKLVEPDNGDLAESDCDYLTG